MVISQYYFHFAENIFQEPGCSLYLYFWKRVNDVYKLLPETYGALSNIDMSNYPTNSFITGHWILCWAYFSRDIPEILNE